MGLVNRPYVGTWQLNNKKVIKHTPDALVYINGDTSVAGCPNCYGKIDVQPYITSVSVDPSTEGPATATFSMHVPFHMGDSFVRDGQFIMHPGLEVHIYFRGFFPVKGILGDTPPQDTGGVSLQNSVMYPYYMVFHGVVTEVNYEYSGGEHTATISCADMLHFWQYQIISTQGSLFGARPDNSKVRMNLIGHNLTGMSPYSIIYTLFRDVGGAAGGVAFALSNETNAAARSTVTQDSLFSLNLLYWQQRFAQSMTSLRMYGADGSLYNAFEAAFIGTISGEQVKQLALKYADNETQRREYDPVYAKKAKAIGFDPFSTYSAAASDRNGSLGVNAAQLQAFVSDIGQWGEVNFFESVYETKLEIANAVKEITGFEFYQDVDGDIVFKPHFYNLDTSSSRVYRIEPIDIDSFSTREGEPEATAVKATSGIFQNLKVGGGLEAEWGTRAEFIDYRLVAQYGWRQKTLGDSSYYNQRRSLFFACIAQMDVFNIGVKSATCSIPLRPELRPGYPVYIRHLDCFYYVQSMSHSFQFGGRCTTTLNLVGKRAKFYAPGKAPGSGIRATINSIDLSNPFLPPLPIEVMGSDEVPRYQGFPNVVMTLDPERINPLTFFKGLTIDNFQTEASVRRLVDVVLSSRTGILEIDPDNAPSNATPDSIYFNGPWKLKTGEGQYISLGNVQSLVQEAKKVGGRLNAISKIEDKAKRNQAQESFFRENESIPFVNLVRVAQNLTNQVLPESDSTAAYLELLSDYKSTFHPGTSLPGYYRYYSASHPDPSQQGPLQIERDEQGNVVTSGLSTVADLNYTKEVLQFAQDGTNDLVIGKPVAGIPVKVPGSKDSVQVLPTHLINSLQIAVFEIGYDNNKVVTLGDKAVGFPQSALASAYADYFRLRMLQETPYGNTNIGDTYAPLYQQIVSEVQPKANLTAFGWSVSSADAYEGDYSYPDIDGAAIVSELPGDGVNDQIEYLAEVYANQIARAASVTLGNISKGVSNGTITIQVDGKDIKQSDSDLNARLLQAWSSCFPLTGDVQSTRLTRIHGIQSTNGRKHSVPIFPVSDAQGYEVVGTFRYGRGISINEGGSFDQLQVRDVTNNTSFDAVEEFLASIGSSTNISKSVGALSVEKRAELASLVGGVDLTVEDGEIRVITPAGDLSAIGHSARPANSKQSTQKITITNAAHSLADMQVSSNHNVCSCKGAEASTLLLAFAGDNFVTVETEEVNDWLLQQAVDQLGSWSATQEAYRGSVLDTKSLKQEVTQAINNVRGTLNTTTNRLGD